MSPGEKIADLIPDPVFEYVREHPQVLYAVTVPLIAWSLYNLLGAVRVHVRAEAFIAARAGDAARLASEALGG